MNSIPLRPIIVRQEKLKVGTLGITGQPFLGIYCEHYTEPGIIFNICHCALCVLWKSRRLDLLKPDTRISMLTEH